MQFYTSLEGVHLQDVWLTIGSFDGVHLGHQEIARRLVAGAHAAGSPAVVLTFFPHPAVVLGKRNDPLYLTTPRERAELLGEMGVDVVVTHTFDRQVAATPAREFIDHLNDHLRLSCLLVGHDFALGRNREGDVSALTHMGAEIGFEVRTIPAVTNDTEVVSSSRVRNTILDGDVEQAARLLGRPYAFPGEVIPGDQRGRTIGIPTANLRVWIERAIPKPGVYVCRAILNDGKRGAVTNIGYRPTFENQPPYPTVETHVLDFEGDLYGQEINLEFLARLRDEQKFPGISALVEQIHKDIDKARVILESK